MSVNVITKGENLKNLLDDTEKEKFFELLIEGGTKRYINNSNSEAALVRIGDTLLPTTISPNKVLKNHDYITSLVAQYLLYTKEEVLKGEKYEEKTKKMVKYGVPLVGTLMSVLKFNKIVWVNNQLTSTALYNTISAVDIDDAIEQLTSIKKGYTLAFRGVCPELSPQLFADLKQKGFVPLSGRLVYIFNPKDESYKKKRPYQQDKKFAEKQEKYFWDTMNPDSESDVARVYELFHKLYIGKHSKHNPEYTQEFIKQAQKAGYMNFEVLKDNETGTIEAVQAVFEDDQVLTTPFIGYNQDKPREDGLYRLMSYRLIERAINENKILNMSSGADSFKKQRGGKPHFEYHMVYAQHLGGLRKWGWKKMEQMLIEHVQPMMMPAVK